MEVPPTAFIIGCTDPRGRLGDEGPSRTVGISRFAFCTDVSNPRTLLWISSGRKLRGSIQVPASMPATLRPARARGRTATPPAAPRPTTATSTGLRLMAILRSVRRAAKGLRHFLQLLIVGGDGEARAGIAEEVPAGESFV